MLFFAFVQCLLDVRDDIFYALQPRGNTDQTGSDADCKPFLFSKLGMRGRSGMRSYGAGIPQVGGHGAELQGIQEFSAAFQSSLCRERNNSPSCFHLFFGYSILRMAFKER